MLRNFATISFLFFSIGQLSAENIPTPDSFSQTSIKEALSQYLNERSTWGTAPSKPRLETAATDAPLTLEAYLARRDAWNKSKSTTPDAGTNTAGALKRYLAERDSWGTTPAKTSSGTVLAEAPLTLEAYLARRDAWNRSTSVTEDAAPDNTGALNRYLAKRDSWGSAPSLSRAEISQSQIKKALQEHLAMRESWGAGPATVLHADARGTQDGRRNNVGKVQTRVAAAAYRNGRDDSPGCIQEVRGIIGSSAIQFSVGSARLTPESRHHLKRVADITRGCPRIRIRIEGHTDSSGNAETNQRLSEARAASVAKYLTTTGINGTNLEAIGFGDTRPLVSNATSALRAQNRRIELTVLTN